MAADPLQHVTKGQTLEITAAAHNAWCDAARAHRDKRFNAGGRVAPTPVTPSVTVLVKNASGSVRDEFSVMAITDQLLDPEDQPFEFRRRPLFEVDDPATADDQIVILNGPLAVDAIGEATISGVAVVDVLINDASHQWARPIAGDQSKLTSGTRGMARIIWMAGSSGTQRCVVLLGRENVHHLSLWLAAVADINPATDDVWETFATLADSTLGTRSLIDVAASAALEMAAGAGMMMIRLYDNIGAAAITGTESICCYGDAGTNAFARGSGKISLAWDAGLADEVDIDVQVRRTTISGSTFASGVLVGAGGLGDTMVRITRVG